MLAPMLAAALALFPADQPSQADQSRSAAQALPVVQATQATHAGPSLAGFGVLVWAPSARAQKTHPRSLWQLFVPEPGATQLFQAPASPAPQGEPKVILYQRMGPVPLTRKVVCGTTLIIVDSQVDPEFVISPKPGAGEFLIRRVPKPMCGDGKK